MNKHAFIAVRVIWALTVVLALVLAARARVFYRWNTVAESSRAIEQIGGQLAYKAEININGGNGQIGIFSFPGSPQEVMRSLNKTFGTTDFNDKRKTGFTILKGDRNVLRLIVLGMSGKTLLFKIDQSREEFDVATEPKTHLLDALPKFPDSTPDFYAEDKNSNMRLAVSSVGTAADVIHNFYEQQLSADGWKRAMPVKLFRGQGMMMYVREREICCVAVASSVRGKHMSSITLLHKKPGLD